MTTTLAEVEKKYGVHFTPDTPVELEKRNNKEAVIKIVVTLPATEEPKKEGSEKSLRETFEEIYAMGEDMGTTDWAKEYKESKLIKD